MELDPQVSPEEIMSREVELGCENWTSFASACSSQCNGQRPCDSAQARQLKQQLRGAPVAGQWRGDTALTLPLFWRRSTVSPVFLGRYPQSSLHSFVPSPLSPSLISNLASVDNMVYKKFLKIPSQPQNQTHVKIAYDFSINSTN